MTSETRQCTNCRQDFIIESADFDFYKKIDVPPPTWCPKCRMVRRLIFRNNFFLYRRKSDFSGEQMFSMIPDTFPGKVYETEIWQSDTWDPLTYGRDVDFSRPLLEQLKELSREVPWRARMVITSVNSDYCNNFSDYKNCYLCFNGDFAEDSAYVVTLQKIKSCFDCAFISGSESCYECFGMFGCNKCFFSSSCESCFDVFFSKNLRGCNNCFGCVNLSGKSYCIFNEQFSREAYFEELKKYLLSSWIDVQDMRKRAAAFWAKFPNKFMEGTQNSDVSGEYISNSKNVKDSYRVLESQNIRYCQYLNSPSSTDCMDVSFFGRGNELGYDSMQIGHGAHGIKFTLGSWSNIRDLEYCLNCLSCSNCFGCMGLRNKEYCILNKQYTKEDYEKLVPKVKKHMMDMPYLGWKGIPFSYGDGVPPDLSPFAYNDTMAHLHFPLTKGQALAAGYGWRDRVEREYSVTISAEKLPSRAEDIPADITEEIIGCEHGATCGHQCTKAFRVIPMEVAFYRQMKLPLPHLCPNCRREELLSQLRPIELHERGCECGGGASTKGGYKNQTTHAHGSNPCPNNFKTSLAPSRPEIVYCEACYNSEVA